MAKWLLAGCVATLLLVALMYLHGPLPGMTPEETQDEAHIRAAPTQAFCDKVRRRSYSGQRIRIT